MKKTRSIYSKLVLAIGLWLSTSTAHSLPITYDLVFTGDNSPSGTGSFVYNSLDFIRDFTWDFGDGIIGYRSYIGPIPKITTPELTLPAMGGSWASLVFEILSETDTFGPADCISGYCSLYNHFVGLAPGDDLTDPNRIMYFELSSNPDVGSSDYRFFYIKRVDDVNFIQVTTASGRISMSFTQVPEPNSLALLILGLFGIRLVSRRKV